MEEGLEQKWKRLALEVGERYQADVILYSGEIEDSIADQAIQIAKDPKRRSNAFLMLATRGGSPDAAFRMARVLQRHYAKFTIYIYGICKSAGTLVAVGAHEIILSDFGEFGPLDIQLGKRDELFETVSGLNITQALNSLNARSLEVFRATLIDFKGGGRGQISTKLAAEIASNFATGLYDKIYAQIDPAQLGAVERSINIASDYGKRLSAKSKNAKRDTIDRLVSGYPSHSFVIDLDEARDLFNNVRHPDRVEEELAECISWVTRDAAKDAFVQKLNLVVESQDGQADGNAAVDQSGGGEKQGGGANHKAPNPAPADAAAAKPRAVK